MAGPPPQPPQPPPPPPREFTVTGEPCRDACIRRAGMLSCVADRTGQVQPCDGGDAEGAPSPAPAAPPGPGIPRYTLSGEPCVFPLHTEGRLYTDCIPLGYEGLVLSCKTSSGMWGTCAPLGAVEGVMGEEGGSTASPGTSSTPVSQGKLSWGAIGALGLLVGTIALVLVGAAVGKLLKRRRCRGGIATQNLRAAASAETPTPGGPTRSVQLSSMFSEPIPMDSIDEPNSPRPAGGSREGGSDGEGNV